MTTCPQCSKSFKPTGRHQQFCSPKCQRKAATIRRPAKPLPDIKCIECQTTFTPRRRDQRFCSPAHAQRFKYNRREVSAPAPSDDLIARIISDGFFLGDLISELALIKKSKSAERSLRGRLRDAIQADACWPVAGPARYALILWLLANPSLLEIPVKWRHQYEKRKFGVVKPSGMMLKRGMGLSYVG